MTDTVATDETAAEPVQEEEKRPEWWRRFTTTRWLARGLEVLAVIPAVATLLEVAAGQRLQYTDYWYVLLRVTTGDGGLYLPGMRVLQNEHPLMLPSVLYWLDAKLAGGDNRVL